MRIVVIGLGSMGKRRIRLLKQNFLEAEVYGIDNNSERRVFCQEEYGIIGYSSFEVALKAEKFDCAFVCTPPLSHNAIIRKCLQNGINVFTEINLVSDGYEENLKLANEKKLSLFLSSTMIYRDEMQYIYEKVKNICQPVSYQYHVGQYLPDWHPWESYKDFFVGEKRTNGCREILTIELPWLTRTFGEICEIKVMRTKLTKLQIGYDDCYMILLKHKSGNAGMFMVELAAREAVRDFKLIGEEIFVCWNGTPEGLVCKNIQEGYIEQIDLYRDIQKEKQYNKTIVENSYVNEMKHFFGELEGRMCKTYGFEDDLKVLRIIDQIEKE